MAIYSVDVRPVARTAGQSSVAGAAYDARTVLTDARTGERWNFRRAHSQERVAADLGVTLPAGSPAELTDRSVLWNAVEAVERRASAQTATRIMVALPDELTDDQSISLARAIVERLVAQGAAVDAVVHCNREPGRVRGDGTVTPLNRHLHLQIPQRPMAADGLGKKSENVYLVRDPSGLEARLSARELREARDAGRPWEKVYKYRRGSSWAQLTPSEAARPEWSGWRRHGRAPVQETRYLAPWLRKEWVEQTRAMVASEINAALAAAGHEDRVDHRSYARQGIDKTPTIHEGHRATSLRRRGVATDRHNENVEIAQTNRATDIERRLTTEIERRRKAAARRPLPRPDADPLAARPITNRPGAVRTVLAKAAREGRVPPPDATRALSRWGVWHARRMRIPILTASADLGASAAMAIARAAVSAVVRLVIAAVPGYRDRLRSHGVHLRRAWDDAHPSALARGGSSSSRYSAGGTAAAPARSRTIDRGAR